MRLRRIKSAERGRRKLGGAIAYELQVSHMGGKAGTNELIVYLGRSQVAELHDLLSSAVDSARLPIASQIWDDLMATFERLCGEYGDLTDTGPEEMTEDDQELVAWGEARGRAQGLSFALAVLRNPLAPDDQAIRRELLARWEDG